MQVSWLCLLWPDSVVSSPIFERVALPAESINAELRPQLHYAQPTCLKGGRAASQNTTRRRQTRYTFIHNEHAFAQSEKYVCTHTI